MTETIFDSDNNFVGYQPRECGEHRTVGSYRAWCYDCGEWCYPRDIDIACKGCMVPALRDRISELERDQ